MEKPVRWTEEAFTIYEVEGLGGPDVHFSRHGSWLWEMGHGRLDVKSDA